MLKSFFSVWTGHIEAEALPSLSKKQFGFQEQFDWGNLWNCSQDILISFSLLCSCKNYGLLLRYVRIFSHQLCGLSLRAKILNCDFGKLGKLSIKKK